MSLNITSSPGLIPDASSGEFAHQLSKGALTTSPNRDMAAHFMRRMNNVSSWKALADGLSYKVMKYNRKSKVREVVTVRPGRGAVRTVQALIRDQPGGLLDGPPDISKTGDPTPAMLAGKFFGDAVWTASLFTLGEPQAPATTGWEGVVSSGRFRPDEEELLLAYSTYYGCDNTGGGCVNSRCPNCWESTGTLQKRAVRMSRFNHTASLKSSSGLGRWKGGNARAAAKPGPADDWVLGDGAGEDVEVWTIRQPRDGYQEAPDVKKLTIGKIVCFFTHIGNKTVIGNHRTRSQTEFVLVFEYINVGVGNRRQTDPATKHPIMRLSAVGRPRVFPVSAIRRHLHLWHLCPTRLHPVNDEGQEIDGDGEELPPRRKSAPARALLPSTWACSIVTAPNGRKVWAHKYKLATPGKGYDKYLLNEHHHSIAQDSFI